MAALSMPSSDAQSVWETYLSPNWLPSVLIADELGVLSSLEGAPGSVDELAGRTGLNPRALGALLPMLASLGYLAPRGGRFHVTDATRDYLLPTSEFYWGGVWTSMRRNNPIVESLRRALTTPDPTEAIPEAHGDRNVDSWASGNIPPERALVMAGYMHSHSASAVVGFAENTDFSSTRRFLDVGGCSGIFSITVAERYPDIRCTVMDLAEVCKLTPQYVAARGLSDRIDTHPADMFRDPWPTGYDAHFFSNMFHDWRYATARELARFSFEALDRGGTINVHEQLLNDDGSGPRTTAAFAILMVAGTQGQQYTFSQLEQMLTEVGFVDIECRATSPLYSLVSARKP